MRKKVLERCSIASLSYFFLFIFKQEQERLASKVYPRTEKSKISILIVDPYHEYSNEAERVN